MTGQSSTFKAAYQYAAPSTLTLVLFFLVFSGPPKLRLRDSMASLQGTVDWSIGLQVAVWLVAGAWVAYGLLHVRDMHREQLSVPEGFGFLLVLVLSLSVPLSVAPALSAFKIYQLLVTMLFASLFVRLYGAYACLEALFWCNAILCAADVIAAVCVPDMVFVVAEGGGERFRGDLIAQTGVVSVLGIILLLTRERQMSRAAAIAAYILFLGVLACSLMRTSYLAILLVAIVGLLTSPHLRRVRRFSRWVLAAAPLLALAGLVSVLDRYRPAESVWTLSDRVGLWTYLAKITWTESPLFGLGYYAASRVYGSQYDPLFGTAHSGFMEMFIGGGATGLAVYSAIWCSLGCYVFLLCSRRLNRNSFTLVALFISVFAFTFIGNAVEADPVGFTYWSLVVMLPIAWRRQQYPQAPGRLEEAVR